MADVLPLESNGLRVLGRIGYANEETNYTAMYRNIRAAISDQIMKDREWLIFAIFYCDSMADRYADELSRSVQNVRCSKCATLGRRT